MLGAAAAAQSDLAPRAAPAEAVLEAALGPMDPDAARSRDPLFELIAAGSDLPVQVADSLLHEAYDVYPTPTTRSRAFGLAASAALNAGRHDLALAWIDWAILEAEQAPERDRLLAERLVTAVGVAVAADNPALARSYVRRGGALTPGFRDDPDRRSVRFEALRLECPDVIEDRYLRTVASADPGVGVLTVPSARCAYAPIRGSPGVGDGGGFTLHAVRTGMDLDARTEAVVEEGVDAKDVEARRTIARRLDFVDTQVTRLFLDEREARLGYARHARRGVDDVAAFAYATALRDGVFYTAAATARVWDWPPEQLGARAETGLRIVLAARVAGPEP
jgi:hypothetical protein